MVDNAVFQTGLPTNTGVSTDEVARADYAIDAGENFVMESATDPNNDSSFTFENIGNYSNDNIVLNGTDASSTNAGDNVVLNGVDSSSTGAGHRVIGESVVEHNSSTLSDIIKPSLLVLDSHIDAGFGRIGGSTPVKQTAIILEESNESGFFMQENETTASGAHGDNILLENRTGFGTNNKLELESDRIIVEDKINDGTIPFQNYINSTLEPITRPADILISGYGSLTLEDESDGAIVLNGTDGSSTNAGGRFRFELATGDNININYPNV